MARFNRRTLIKAIPLGAAAGLLDGSGLFSRLRYGALSDEISRLLEPLEPARDEGALRIASTGGAHLHKIQNFDATYPDDYRLAARKMPVLRATARRIERALRVVGHGHFNLVSYDDLVRYAGRYGEIGAFERAELDFLDEIFYTDATRYGFYGEKVITDKHAVIPRKAVKKIARTGHFLLRGEPLEKYERIRRDVGDQVFLTSGVRSIGKQYQLFLSKAVETGGNLSQASRSLAPPGYSYHAIGDFDVGRVGYGLRNFTEEFAQTPEYKKLIDLGYVAIRYTETNPFGVRHEPWHIKIV